MLKKTYKKCCSMCLGSVFIFGALLFVMVGCSDSEGPSTVSGLTITNAKTSFTIGVSAHVDFKVSNGTDNYRWRATYSSGLTTSEFSFTYADASATLSYHGGATTSGTITVTVKDDTGKTASKIIAVEGDDFLSKLEFNPKAVENNEEVLTVFTLLYKSSHAPVVGSIVTFTILEGPATFIDAEGKDLGASTTGTAPTGTNGKAMARIRAGDTEVTTYVIVKAVSDTGAAVTGSFTVLGRKYDPTLEVSPETIGAHGQLLSIFKLLYRRTSEPVVGSMVTFKIIQGPATFIDAEGEDLGDSTTGVEPTDSNGIVMARIRAGFTPETTYVIVAAKSDTGAAATTSFTIETGLSLIEFEPGPEDPYHDTVYTVRYVYEGESPPPEVDFILPFSVKQTDGHGNPMAHTDIVLDAYLPSESILSVTLGDFIALPATLTTDDDGNSHFVLHVTVGTGDIAAGGNIGSLVLTGTGSYGVRGSFAIMFNVERTKPGQKLYIEPAFTWVTDGQSVSFSAGGGVPPYTWSAGKGTLNDTAGQAVIYTAPTPAVGDVVTVTDDKGSTAVAKVTPL